MVFSQALTTRYCELKRLCFYLFCLLCGVVSADSAYQRWDQHRDRIKNDPSLVAYYTFEDFDGMLIKNLAGKQRNFYAENISLVPGRFPGKQAIYTEDSKRSFISNPGGDPGESFDSRGNAFTFEIWMLKITESADDYYGFLFGYPTGNCGSWNGWRMFTGFPHGRVTLTMGHPGPGELAWFHTTPADANVWNHVVATWDGQEVRMYLNGKLSSAREYKGPYYPDPLNGAAWLGGIGRPLGHLPRRALLAIDELAIYSRALSENEVYEHFLAGGGASVSAVEKLPAPEITVAVNPPRPPPVFHGPFRRRGLQEYTASYGYFTRGSDIPVIFTAAANAGERYSAVIKLLDKENRPVFQEEITVVFKQEKTAVQNIRLPDQCGIYWLQVTVVENDKSKKMVCRHEFPLGVTVKLPDIKDISDDSPLGAQSASWRPETRFYGMKWDRGIYSALRWPQIEKVQGEYDWSEGDRIVDEVTENGHTPIILIHGVPDWAIKKPAQGPPNPLYGPKDVEDLKRFVSKMVNRYKDRVRHWEVWNEPECGLHVDGDEGIFSSAPRWDEYVRILKAAYEAIKESDPTAMVIGLNGVPGRFVKGTESVLKRGGGDYMDILGVHNYVYGNPNEFFAHERRIEKVRDIMLRYMGREIPIWDMETAFHQPLRVNGRPMEEEYFLRHFKMLPGKDFYIQGCLTMVPEHRSAYWEIQSTLMDFATGVDKRILHSTGGLHGYPVNEKGIAFAALAKVVTDRKEIKQIDMGTDDARGVLITGKNGKRTAVLWSATARPAFVSMVFSRDRVYEGMDFLGNPVRTGRPKQSLLTLQLTEEPLYVFDVPADLTGVTLMEIRGENIADTKTPYTGEIVVRNPLKTKLAGRIQPELPEGWRAEIDNEVKIAADSTITVPFTLYAPPQQAEDILLVRFLFVSGKDTLTSLEKSVLLKEMRVIPKAIRNIILDGTGTSRGEKYCSATANNEEQVAIGKYDPFLPVAHPHWKGPDDLSFTVSTVWKDNELYLLVEVTDDEILPAPEGEEGNAYIYDCVEIFIDIRSDPEEFTNEWTLHLGRQGAIQILVVPAVTEHFIGLKTVHLGTGIESRFAGRKTENGYLVEGRIHPAPGSGLSIKEGQVIGLDVGVNDASAETGGKRKTQMVLFGSGRNYKNPAYWGRFRLEK